jgi:2-methylisocitrate lyase-like PEP mutase family enzyme
MPTSRVQTIIDREQAIVFPGVYDTLSAKLAERAGFPMAFISGYSVAATLIGEPDMGLLTQTEIVERARHVCGSVKIPIIVDADTGYGNPLNVIRTIRDLINVGAAGCFLEDQEWPKKCGHMRGKRVIEREEYLDKIRAAVDTRGDADFFIVARTDSLAVKGLDEAIARVAAAREIGANASFVEAPNSIEELATIGRRAPAPIVANMIEKGKTPVLPKEELVRLGFQLIVYPLAGLFAAAEAIAKIYQKIRSDENDPGISRTTDGLRRIQPIDWRRRKICDCGALRGSRLVHRTYNSQSVGSAVNRRDFFAFRRLCAGRQTTSITVKCRIQAKLNGVARARRVGVHEDL